MSSNPAGSRGLIKETMDKTIIGRIGEMTISETIQNYQSSIPEQVLTTKKNIRNKFADLGFEPKEVVFDK